MREFGPQSACRAETLGADLTTSAGTTVTAAGAANTKGAWVTIGTAAFSYEELTVFLESASALGAYAVDIGINDGANTWPIAQDILWNPAASGGGTMYVFPLHVPAGSIIQARVAAAAGSRTVGVHLMGKSTNLLGVPGYARMVPLTATSSSNGILCTGGAINTKARTQLVASSAADVAALLLLLETNATTPRGLADLEAGAAAAEEVLMANLLYSSIGSDNKGGRQFTLSRFFPAATRFSLNIQSSSASPTLRAMLYGFQ